MACVTLGLFEQFEGDTLVPESELIAALNLPERVWKQVIRPILCSRRPLTTDGDRVRLTPAGMLVNSRTDPNMLSYLSFEFIVEE